MNVGTISPQQLRSIVEDKWQRDEEATAVGLHVTTAWRGPERGGIRLRQGVRRPCRHGLSGP